MSGDSDGAELAVVCGPTAAGKSAVAQWLAELTPTTILSADSRQVYRGFDIGTAKPSVAERECVPHRGIDVVDPTARYSAAEWAASADGWVDDARSAGRAPLVVGGTGLYLRALVDGLFDEPLLDATRRAQLAGELDQLNVDELRRWVRSLDPARAHLGRTQLRRAIEIALLTGERVSDLHRSRSRPGRWRARYLLVDPGPTLGGRIAARIDQMLDNGWPDEVRRLMETVPADAPAWKSTGYDAVRRLVSGAWSRPATRERILIDTRQYAKRQRTWFRHQLPGLPAGEGRVTLLDPLAPDWRAVAERWYRGPRT